MSGVDRQSISRMVEEHVRNGVHRLGHTGWKLALAVSVCANLLLVAGYWNVYLNDLYFRLWVNASFPEAIYLATLAGVATGILGNIVMAAASLLRRLRANRMTSIVNEVLRKLAEGGS